MAHESRRVGGASLLIMCPTANSVCKHVGRPCHIEAGMARRVYDVVDDVTSSLGATLRPTYDIIADVSSGMRQKFRRHSREHMAHARLHRRLVASERRSYKLKKGIIAMADKHAVRNSDIPRVLRKHAIATASCPTCLLWQRACP